MTVPHEGSWKNVKMKALSPTGLFRKEKCKPGCILCGINDKMAFVFTSPDDRGDRPRGGVIAVRTHSLE